MPKLISPRPWRSPAAPSRPQLRRPRRRASGPDYTARRQTAAGVRRGPADVYSTEDGTVRSGGSSTIDLLNRLVIEALTANHDLRIALAHLQQARALRTQALLDLLPTVTAAGGYTSSSMPAAESLVRRSAG